MKKLLAKIRKILKDRRTRQLLTRIVSITAAVVVFITTYALVLPAITMESEANCGIPAHQHDDSCYEDRLICGQVESPGHQHTDACYSISKALTCTETEHQHDDSCLDADGNLTCELAEHTHDDSCYKEVRELVCDIPESEGHEHTADCYERVLACGMEAHTHSTACYSHGSELTASAPSDFAAVATTELGSYGATISASTETEANSEETSNTWASDESTAGGLSSTAAGATNAEAADYSSTATATGTASTGFDAATAEDAFVPQLEPIYLEQLLTKDTDIYYYHAEEGEEVPENSADIADWKRVNDDTELAPADLLRVYLRYSIPAGALNPTNDIARYRLPSNLHLTDQQMEAINTTVNGIANQYVNLDTLEITDTERYSTYLGIEATEGTRKPSDNIDEYFTNHPDLEGQEYINAVVRAENVFDETTEEYLGQDLVFTFTPYTVQKNQHEYDVEGQPTKAGQKVNGWLCFDLHMDQIDWSEPIVSTIEDPAAPAQDVTIENTEDTNSADTTEATEKAASDMDEDASLSSSNPYELNTNTITEKKESSAEIVFAAKDKALKIDEIRTEIHLVEFNTIEKENDAAQDEPDQSADDSTDNANSEMTDAEGDTADDSNPEGETDKSGSADDSATDIENQPESATDINAETYPAVSFEDTITVQAGTLSTDNENAAKDTPAETAITVSVIAQEETFPLGTTMHLGTVEDMDTVASAVEGTVEGQTRGFHAVDISFHNADGEEIEPLKPIKVNMTSDAIKQAVEDSSTAPVVVHVENSPEAPGEDKDSAVLPANSTDAEENSANINLQSDRDAVTSENTPIATIVETNETSTIDGSSESAKTLDTLSFDAGSFSVYAIVYTVDFHYEVDGKEYSYSITGGSAVSLKELVQIVNAVEETEADHFVKEIKDVSFSNADLAWVGKTEESITVGALKEANLLTACYSEELTDEKINNINSKLIDAGEWVFISLLPFNTQETLTVTMKGGDVFTIKVSDAQIKKTVLSSSGETYEVTITYNDDAQIPDGSDLIVREILMNETTEESADENKYAEYLTRTAALLDHQENDVVYARYFDISIVDGQGNKIEPKSEVEVQIRLSDRDSSVSPKVLHFDAEEKIPEIMDTYDNGEILRFDTEGFSVYGIVIIEEEEGTFVFNGEGYTVHVSYTKEAQIPFGTTLEISEIEEGTDRYNTLLGQAWMEINKEYFESQELLKNYKEWMGDVPESHLVNLNVAKFFNITLYYNGEEFEPKASVHVEIEYDNGLSIHGATEFGIAHYKDENDLEIIKDVETTVRGDKVYSYRYEQDGFSEVAAYAGMQTEDIQKEPDILDAPSKADITSLEDISSPASVDSIINKSLRSLGRVFKAVRGAEQPYTSDESGLPYPVGNKTLVANKDENDQEDGTYTLSLSVKGSSFTSLDENITKSNVLVVMDRSSSMISNSASEEYIPYWVNENNYFHTGNTTGSGKSHMTYYGLVNGNYMPLNVTGNSERLLKYTGTGNLNAQGYYTYDSSQAGYEYVWVTTSYNITYLAGGRYVDYNGTVYVRSYETRLAAEQGALSQLFNKLLSQNGTGTNSQGVSLEDIIEISVISFADQKYQGQDTEVDWTTDYDELIPSDSLTGVSSNRYTSGTNWEDALQYALSVANAKKDEDGDVEDYYIIFLTDGEPTATAGETGGAYHYNNERQGFGYAYDRAKDDAAAIVNAGYKLYNIFTYGTDEDYSYMIRLTNYAYSNGSDDSTNENTDAVKTYFTNAKNTATLVNAFNIIFNKIETSIGHANVSITDTLTTDAMTTTVVQGKTNGYTYTVTEPNPEDPENPTVLYTVTAKGAVDSPTVTFNVPDSAVKNYEATSSEVEGKKVYSVTTVEGITYKMALADVNDTTGELEWDLSPVGMLMNDCTYTVSFVVWPDQDAYDFVAALNNGLAGYQFNNPTYNAERGYWEGDAVKVQMDEDGNVVIDEETGNPIILASYPSVVRYGEGEGAIFAVLTNTDQKLHYSVVETETVNGVPSEPKITGPFYTDLEIPEPMKLTAAGSRVSKLWNVSRDPDALLRLLYEFDGNVPRVDESGNPIPKEYTVPVIDPETGLQGVDPDTNEPLTRTYTGFFMDFKIMQDTTDPAADAYKTVRLGWDENQGKYVWYDGTGPGAPYVKSKIYETPSGPVTLTYGTRWEQDFSIATGLMVSYDRLVELGLDPADYASGSYEDEEGNSVTYYLLEDGHDYTLSEPDLGYEFDFDAPTYHPMLVDGVMKSVRFTKTGDKTISISEIEELEISTDGMSLLEIINTLRGYIHVKKVVTADNFDVKDDETKFTYDVYLYNDDGAFTVEGAHIPWYGIDGLFYHTEVTNEEGDVEYQYYQAHALGTETGDNGETIGVLTLTDEHGNTYTARCAGKFDEDIVGPTDVTFEQDGSPKTIRLYGNQMDYSEEIMETDPDTGEPVHTGAYRKVHATFMINQKQQLNIANVPVSTRYEITERDERGYEYVKIESNATVEKVDAQKEVTGTIVPNSDIEITYTNKAVKGDLNLQKKVTINEFDPSNEAVTDKTLADGEYTFHVTGKEGTDTAGNSYDVKITISQGVAAAAQIRDNGAETPAFADVTLVNGAVPLHNLTPGVYTITEDASAKTLCTAINSTNAVNQTDLDNRQVEVTVGPGTSNVNLITFINNYAEEGVTDIAHISVRKTFKGISRNGIPAGFKINVAVTYTVTENGSQVEKTLPYELTGASDTEHGVLWHETVGDNEVVWDWTIAIQGLTPAANVTVQEVNYDKPGYEVTTSGNPTDDDPDSDGTSYSGTVVPSTTITRLEEVITEQNSSVYPVDDTGDEATIFIARIIPSQTALVISKKRLNLNERASLEEMLRHMPNAQDWYNGQQPLYFSFEQAANNEITIRSDFHVTYFEENGHGYFRFEDKKIWNMVATRKIIYKEGRPADFNFENSYSEIPVDLDVIKVDGEDGSKKLGGAAFTLRKLTETGGNPPAPTANGTFDGTQMAASNPAETADGTGKTTFAGLTKGYYELTETKAPDGYIMMTNQPVYFRVADGAVKWIEWSAEEGKWVDIENGPEDGTVTFEQAQAAVPDNLETDEDESQPAKNAAFVIGNTPGAALPNTGGLGTNLIYLFGIILTGFAGTGLMVKRRKRKAA